MRWETIVMGMEKRGGWMENMSNMPEVVWRSLSVYPVRVDLTSHARTTLHGKDQDSFPRYRQAE